MQRTNRHGRALGALFATLSTIVFASRPALASNPPDTNHHGAGRVIATPIDTLVHARHHPHGDDSHRDPAAYTGPRGGGPFYLDRHPHDARTHHRRVL